MIWYNTFTWMKLGNWWSHNLYVLFSTVCLVLGW
jgi:hypothetical protein